MEKHYKTTLIERSLELITKSDLRDLYNGSVKRLYEYFLYGRGKKWLRLYDIKQPLAVALCQGAAMHFYDKKNGVKDFDVWFFYPFNQKPLPYRSIWKWDYVNAKFGRHPTIPGYTGRKVDVIVRSIREYNPNNPIKSVQQFLRTRGRTPLMLSQKAVVMLHPKKLLGRVVWYKQNPINAEPGDPASPSQLNAHG